MNYSYLQYVIIILLISQSNMVKFYSTVAHSIVKKYLFIVHTFVHTFQVKFFIADELLLIFSMSINIRDTILEIY